MQIQDFKGKMLQIQKFFTVMQNTFCDIVLKLSFLNIITLYKTINNEKLFNKKNQLLIS